ncbi:MAG: ADP-ribosylglycohydrolase family protein, partial [Actinomycetota bacterium]|nr:ADP-ribosylglycohydrolase family protein [Actinomycetota bacterium]
MDEHQRDRVVGALLGLFVGDAAGARSEGGPPDPGRAVPEPAPGRWSYTDDTQMALALAEHLLEADGVDPERLARRFQARYEPRRGYGYGTRQVLAAWHAGTPVTEAAGALFDGGSFGNGAAMRVAPVGARFHGDPWRVRAEA